MNMNLKNLKKIYRIDKKIIFRKLINKINNKLLDKLYFFRDSNLSTYSYDYISFFRTEHKAIDIAELLNIPQYDNKITEYCDNSINHKFAILSNQLTDVNTKTDFNNIQSKFNKKLIPFSTKSYNLISNNYEMINWQKDFNSGKCWEFKWYKHISFGNSNGSDIKVPWEVGRLQHLPNLALCFKKSNNEEILLEIRNQLFDFMASNPPNFGVQWMTSMDIGIRLVNILITLQILGFETYFNKVELELIDSYLYDHFQHIKNNIEYSEGMRGNHYLSNLCSLIIYLIFVKSDDSQILLEKYFKLIEIELEYQFNDDGTNFEASTRYHIFTNQMLVTTDLLLKELSNKILNSEKMNFICSFTYKLLEFEYPPQIGDNDSGFYWKINNSENETYKCLKSLIEKHYNINVEYNYPNYGYIERKYEGFSFILKCGKVGQNGKGGHDHNDNLSYLLYYRNIPFIVDIGSYSYTNNFEKRNYYRASKQHNVMTIEDNEQNDFSMESNDDMFWLDSNKSNPQVVVQNKDEMKGQINYCGKPYIREVQFNSNEILISDIINNDIEKNINIYLHPNIQITNVEKGVYKLLKDENSLILETFDSSAEISDYYFSPQYGVEEIAKKITLKSSDNIIMHKLRAEKN